jgi:transcriptional regulator NrdR family protein
MTYLTCPWCESDNLRVVDRRGKRRRRECRDCGGRCSSVERILPPRPDYLHRAPVRGQMELGF